MSLPDPASESGRVDWAGYLSRVLPEVDIFVPSIEELLFMMDRPLFDRLAADGGGEAVLRGVSFADLARIGDAVLAHGVSALMIKLGDRGAYLRTARRLPALLQGWEDRELYTPVFAVPHVAGTTGAGDATIAGFLASACKGLSPERALTMAVAVGGCCVEAPDATSGILPWEVTEKRVSDGWEKAPAAAPAAGWKSGGGGMWRGPNDQGPR
jgi:sugar/nucleoside kinase (ribokinase family)